MPKLLTLTVLLLFIISCKPDIIDDRLKEKLKIYFTETFRNIDSTVKIDSLRVIKLDTLAQNDIIYFKINSLYDEMDSNEPLKQELDGKYNSSIDLAKLYKGLDKTLFDHYIEEAQDAIKKIKEIHSIDSGLLKQAMDLETKLDKADTIKLLYYRAACLLQYHLKDQSTKKDTFYAFLNLDKNIIKREDLTW